MGGPGGWLKDDMRGVKSMDLLSEFLVKMNSCWFNKEEMFFA
jgi:hypothetical protein